MDRRAHLARKGFTTLLETNFVEIGPIVCPDLEVTHSVSQCSGKSLICMHAPHKQANEQIGFNAIYHDLVRNNNLS